MTERIYFVNCEDSQIEILRLITMDNILYIRYAWFLVNTPGLDANSLFHTRGLTIIYENNTLTIKSSDGDYYNMSHPCDGFIEL